MAEEVDNNKDFISQINEQSIFKIFYNDSIEEEPSKILNGSKLVVRNDSDFFYAHENLVRGCTVNHYSTNYRLLDNKFDDFKICSLSMNSSGTLLAIIGAQEVAVVSLPLSITATNDPVLPTKSYKLKNIDGNIKEVLWQSIVANDCCLVILNDRNEVKAYDISISTDIPQLTIRLDDYEHLKNETIKSINFGAESTIPGSLTLYLALSNSIYAIYPFICRNAKLAVNKEMSEAFLEESTQILNNIDSAFFSKSSIPHPSGLKEAALSQYKYASSIDASLNSKVPLRNEYRKILSNDIDILSIVEQYLGDDFKVSLQGPLIQSKNEVINNIQSIGNKCNISILVVSFSIEKKSTKLHYYAQLKPLIMQLKEKMMVSDVSRRDESSNKINQFTDDHKSVSQYVKPAKGFGYIEVEDPEGRHESDTTEKISSNERLDAELKYWETQFTFLNLLSIDQISMDHDCISFYAFGSEESKQFLISDNNKFIICDPSRWIARLENSEYSNENLLDVETSYRSISKKEGRLSSAAVIRDRILGSGEFLVLLRDKKEENLEVVQISTTASQLPKEAEKFNQHELPQYESILKKEPFEEIEKGLERVKLIDATTLRSAISPEFYTQKVCCNDVKSLENMNALSIKVLQEIFNLTAFAFSVDSRISMDLTDLRIQIDEFERFKKTEATKSKAGENKQRLTSLEERQDQIYQRGIKLKNKLYNAIQKSKYNESLPLSNAEKSWFRELNTINSQTSKGKNGDDNLLNSYTEIEAQVKSLVKQAKKENGMSSDGVISPSEKLTKLTMLRELQKIRIHLEKRTSLLSITKSRLDEGLQKLSY